MPGFKTKITRHWMGTLIITEILCDILFRIHHSDSSPSVIIHWENLEKKYGPNTITLRAVRRNQKDAKQPDLPCFVHSVVQQTVRNTSKVVISSDDIFKYVVLIGHMFYNPIF